MNKLAFLCAWFLISGMPFLFAQGVLINEVITSNSSINTDDDGSYQDWIELYNSGTQSLDLNGYGLTDDSSDPFKWTFPEISLSPGMHLLIWCSDKNRSDPMAPLHTNFKISSDGETISLTAPDGTLEDEFDPVQIPQNSSYGRSPSGNSVLTVFTIPTPGFENGFGTATGVLDPPGFSSVSGIYELGFALSLSHPDPEVTILYTLDGSEPDASRLSGQTYSYKNQYPEFGPGPIGEILTESFTTLAYENTLTIADRSAEPNKISMISTSLHENPPYYLPQSPLVKATVVRAKAVKPGLQDSKIITHTYLVGAAANFTLPVASISINENEFFDFQEGIGVAGQIFEQWRAANPDLPGLFGETNFSQSGDDWEIKGNFNYFVNQSQVLNQDIGIRINGGFSRNFPNKSLRLYARSEYGASNFNYPFFGSDYQSDNFKRIVMRNAGNDNMGSYLRDAFIQRSVSHLNFSIQPYQPSILFLNGEYWGILNFRERYDKTYFSRIYGVPENELDFLEYNGYLVQEGDYEHYANMINYLQSANLSESSSFEYIKTQMDVENYADFFIANIYANNIDWPHNNVEFWRKRTASYQPDAPYGQDGRWRWVLKDTDFGFGNSQLPNPAEHNTLAFATSIGGSEVSNPEWSTFLMRKLLENTTYRNYFINRFADLINTAYRPQRLGEILDVMKTQLAPEIAMHGQRWNAISSQSWEASTQSIMEFANQRPANQRLHIEQKFNIQGQLMATLNVAPANLGLIEINTIAISEQTPGVDENPYPWQGIYFNSIPMTIRAVALPGFVFSHWSGAHNGNQSEITITPTADFSLTAHFIPSSENPEIPLSFWMANTSLANDTPFESIASTYEFASEGILEYHSALDGYPFNEGHPLWRKASLERANEPTDLNYLPLANNDLPFGSANMRGLQVRQPFSSESGQNTLVFHQSTTSYKEIVARFAAKDEGAASALSIDYSLNAGLDWINTGLAQTQLPLQQDYNLYEIDFASLELVNDNPDFQLRIQFIGADMTADDGGKVLFNNFSFSGKSMLGLHPTQSLPIVLYPNPAGDMLYLGTQQRQFSYSLYGIDGKLFKSARLDTNAIQLSGLHPGMYLLELESALGKSIHKIVKK